MDRARSGRRDALAHDDDAAHGFPNAVVGHAEAAIATSIAEVLAAHAIPAGPRHPPQARVGPLRPPRPARTTGSMDDGSGGRLSRCSSATAFLDLQTPWWHSTPRRELARTSPTTQNIVNHTGLPADRHQPQGSPAGGARWKSSPAEPNVASKFRGSAARPALDGRGQRPDHPSTPSRSSGRTVACSRAISRR